MGINYQHMRAYGILAYSRTVSCSGDMGLRMAKDSTHRELRLLISHDRYCMSTGRFTALRAYTS